MNYNRWCLEGWIVYRTPLECLKHRKNDAHWPKKPQSLQKKVTVRLKKFFWSKFSQIGPFFDPMAPIFMRFLIFFGCPQLSAFQRSIVLPNQPCLANAESFILEASRLQSKKPTKSPDKKRKIEKSKKNLHPQNAFCQKKKHTQFPEAIRKGRERESRTDKEQSGPLSGLSLTTAAPHLLEFFFSSALLFCL